MKQHMQIGFVLSVPLLAFIVAGCEHGPEGVPATATCAGHQEIPWTRVVELFREGRVQWVSQTHDLVVSIGLVDGTECWAMEPRIDALYPLVREAPNRSTIGLSTE